MGCERRRNRTDLLTALQVEWDRMVEEELIIKFVEGMPQRCLAVIEACGGRTRHLTLFRFDFTCLIPRVYFFDIVGVVSSENVVSGSRAMHLHTHQARLKSISYQRKLKSFHGQAPLHT